MPNRRLTPGAALPGVTAAQVCRSGWASAHRNVSLSEKDAVYAEYGIASHAAYSYEIDHLVPLELGGANSEANLWPEPYHAAGGATAKDGLEDYLHARVCAGQLSLARAQHEIAANWYRAWLAAGKPEGDRPPSPPTGSGGKASASRPTPAAPTLRSGQFCSATKEGYYERHGYHCTPGADGRNRLSG